MENKKDLVLFKGSCGALVFVIAGVILPFATSLIEAWSSADVAQASSLVERASSGYLRFNIWTQMLLAVQQHPWLGYGWNQTSVAQMSAYALFQQLSGRPVPIIFY